MCSSLYIYNFQGKNFSSFFFLNFLFSKRPCGPRFMSKKKYYQKPSSSFPPTFNKMHFGYFKTPLFKTYLHTFKLESFFGNILHFWGNLLIILGQRCKWKIYYLKTLVLLLKLRKFKIFLIFALCNWEIQVFQNIQKKVDENLYNYNIIQISFSGLCWNFFNMEFKLIYEKFTYFSVFFKNWIFFIK